VLLHVASLPSPYGIGDVRPAALAWVDPLHEAGQSWWQALPLGPTGYGNSPYQSLSSFAGNELLISPDGLIEDGLLWVKDCESNSFAAAAIDYDVVIPFSTGCSKRPGPISALGRARTCGPLLINFATTRCTGSKTTPCSGR
jgi:4-alpha-glucanotransferase